MSGKTTRTVSISSFATSRFSSLMSTFPCIVVS
jgi:hypothetical protein